MCVGVGEGKALLSTRPELPESSVWAEGMRGLKSKPRPLAAALGDVCDGWCNKWCWEHRDGQISLITSFKEQLHSLFGQGKEHCGVVPSGLLVHIPLPASLPEDAALGGGGGFDGCCAERTGAKGLLLFH